MQERFDAEEVARFENATWSRCAKGYMGGFGALAGEAIGPHAGAADLPHGPLFGVGAFEVFHQMTRDAGFRDSSVRELQIAWRTRSIDPFLAAFRDWAQLDASPKDIREAIEATVRERASAYRSGDVFTMPNPAILVSAVR